MKESGMDRNQFCDCAAREAESGGTKHPGCHEDDPCVMTPAQYFLRLKGGLLFGIWRIIDDYVEKEDVSVRDRLVGAVFSILSAIDGEAAPYIPYKLVPRDCSPQEMAGHDGIIDLHHDFHYCRPRVRG